MKNQTNFQAIEKKWQNKWEKAKLFEVKESSKKKYYVLDMFPYPSGEGLHIGHTFVYSLGDIYARFKRLQGLNVLYPIGYDSFGLPAENAAIKAKTTPQEYTKKSIANFMKQQKAMGWSYDWSRVVKSHEPSFYKWDQWIFLKMYEKGLAFRKKAPVNYCPKCETVLANEQVINGKCWRHEDTEIEIKHLEQWFLRTTKYAEKLLNGLEKLNWPERAKRMQRNWIGKSLGTEINFEIKGKNWPVFTTRPDTIFGVTFLIISAQHTNLNEFVTEKQKSELKAFLRKIKNTSQEDMEKLDKEGIFTGSYATNPITKEEIPIYAGNFVLPDYGSGIVMAVPAHDKRDFEFAKKYNLPIKEVIKSNQSTLNEAYILPGKLINSREFNNLDSNNAKEKITKYLEQNSLGKKTIQFKLKDWLISRQRYWGTPIPMMYCDKCGIIPVPEKNLPVKLPEKVKFGKGNPLKTNPSFINTKCPKCKSPARRETDTMDTFANSSWYYLRYTDPTNNDKIFDTKKANYWTPIDQYIGGPEHITAHLIYIRFYTKFLNSLGLINFDEPALKYFTQGFVYGVDGEKMSKSKGNVVEPLEMINKYGADTLRMYLVSNGSPENSFSWNPKGPENTHKFLKKVFNFFNNLKTNKSSEKIESKINKAIIEITKDIEEFKHNLAIIKIRELFSIIEKENSINKKNAQTFLKLLHIYCPFLTEELWEGLGNKQFISKESWPIPDESKINQKLEIQEQALEKTIQDINNIIKIVKEKSKTSPKIVYIYTIPPEKNNYNKKELENRLSLKVKVFASNEKNIHDPDSKARKAKPGKPGIYLE